MSLDAFEYLFFDSARKASNDVSTFLNLRFIKKQKSAVFLRKCYMLTISKLALFSMDLFVAADGWGVLFGPSFLKSDTHILQ